QRSRLLSPCYLYWSANAQRLARGQRGLQRRPAGVAVDLRHPSIADMLDERSQLIAVAIAYRHAQLGRQHAMPLPACGQEQIRLRRVAQQDRPVAAENIVARLVRVAGVARDLDVPDRPSTHAQAD